MRRRDVIAGLLVVATTGRAQAREYVELGGLMAFSADFGELFRQLAGQIDLILKGRKPSEIPIYQASKFALSINLKTARALGLTIPPSLLASADEVIE